MTILRPRKPRAMKTAEVERMLRAASAADLPEPSPDLVARAVERALASEAKRGSLWSPFAAGSSRGVAFGAVALAGVAAFAIVMVVDIPPSQHLPHLLHTAAVTDTPPFVAQTAIAPAETTLPRPFFATRALVPSVHPLTPHRLTARYRRLQRARRRSASPVRLVALPLSAPKLQSLSAPIAPPKHLLRHSTRMVAVTAPKPRPFWHDEQVERDDYVVSAPVIVAEGTGQEVTSLMPAVVQVTFSTTQPVVESTYSGNDTNP